jgi:hypothetical protein
LAFFALLPFAIACPLENHAFTQPYLKRRD